MKRAKAKIAFLLVLAMAVSMASAGCGSQKNSAVQASSSAAAPVSASVSAPVSASASVTAAPAASSTPSSSGSHTVTDMIGNKVTIPDKVTSIISTTPAVSQILLALGAGKQITAGFVLSNTLNKAMFPYISNIPSVKAADLNAETALNYKPSFIVWGSGDKVPEGITAAKIPVITATISNSNDLITATKLLADALGGDASSKAATYKDFYEKLKKQDSDLTSGIDKKNKPVVYFTSSDDGLTTFGTESMPDEWIALSGGVFSSEVLGIKGFDATITAEQLISVNPDIIITASAAAKKMFMSDTKYAGLKAVKNGKVYVNPTGGSVWYKGHVEAPLELAWAPSVISPNVAGSIDTKSLVKEFYKTFYAYSLSDDELGGILNQ